MTACARELPITCLPLRAEYLPHDPEEARWLVRARTGDAAALGWLLERYRTRTVRLAAHVLRAEADAEDVAQEAFVRAFRRLHTLRGDGASFGPWLRRIVVRLCLDRLRRGRHEASALTDDDWDALAPADLADTRLLIEALLDTLSPPLRAALVLREMEGLDYDEIAHVLAVPVGTVRSRLHAARAQFRALWLDAHQEETPHA